MLTTPIITQTVETMTDNNNNILQHENKSNNLSSNDGEDNNNLLDTDHNDYGLELQAMNENKSSFDSKDSITVLCKYDSVIFAYTETLVLVSNVMCDLILILCFAYSLSSLILLF